MSSQYKLMESKIQTALRALQEKRCKNPKISIRSVAKEFNVPYTTFYHRLQGRSSRSTRKRVNLRLNDVQYKVLFDTIDAYDRVGVAVTPALIKEAAEGILQPSTDPAGPRPKLSKNWVCNPEYDRKVQRARAEDQDPDVVNKGS